MQVITKAVVATPRGREGRARWRVRPVVWLAAAGMAALAWAGPAASDFKSGWEAYQKADFQGAFEAWEPLAEAGDPLAQFNVGTLYDEGRGVPRNLDKAVEWWTKAAEQGYARAQHNLGLIYIGGGPGGLEHHAGPAQPSRATIGDVGASP